jgi:hypothetical protein
MNTLHKFSVVLLIISGTIALSAESKPNLSGTWELNTQKSDLGGAPITKLVAQVEYKDPVLKYTVTGKAGGEDFTETETLFTDGRPTTDSRGAQIKAHWEGTTLMIEAAGDQGGALDMARITLSRDGKTMTRDYERKSPDDPQKRHEIYDKR